MEDICDQIDNIDGTEFLYVSKSPTTSRNGPTELRQLEIDREELPIVGAALKAFCDQNNISLKLNYDECACDCSCCCDCEPEISIERPSGACFIIKD